MKLNVSMEPDNTHPRALKELADAVAKCLSITFEKSWLPGEVTSLGLLIMLFLM